jgi:hypothetical protein
MRPTRVPESELHGAEGEDQSDTGETATADEQTEDSEVTPTDHGDDDSTTARRNRRNGHDSSGGLLAWLKSLF